MKRLFIFLLTLTPVLFAEPELTGSPAELAGYLQDIPQTVRITGTAEKKVPADRAIIQLKVTTESRSMSDALNENRSLRANITKTLLMAGLTTNHVQAAQFSSTPQSGFFSDKIRKYTVENTMKATVINEEQFRAVAQLIDQHEEVTYEKTDFELSTKKETERLLLAEACRDAVAKKNLYETELQVSLVIHRFYEGNVATRRAAPMMLQRAKAMYSSLAEDSSVPPPVQFEEMQLNASVNIDYRLESK
jgi:uncharacterized protein YggE